MDCPSKLNVGFPNNVGALTMPYQGRSYRFSTKWTNDDWWPWGSTSTYMPDVDPIPDQTGTMVWVGASIRVRCQKSWWEDATGTPHYSADFIILAQNGSVRPQSTACTDGGGAGPGVDNDVDGPGSYSGGEYDPYDPLGDGGSCDPNAPLNSGGGGGSNCTTEYVYVDVSYDGGATWTEIWEGETDVCS